jgi:hypothetical protein
MAINMQQENTFKTTLLISLIMHAAILASMPYMKSVPKKKELTNLEITYRHFAQTIGKQKKHGISKELMSSRPKNLPKAEIPKSAPKIQENLKIDPARLTKPNQSISIPKPQINTQRPKIKRINLKDLPVETSKDPAYLSYRDIIRRKIQDKVYYFSDQYFYFDNPREGKIFISFTIASDGSLRDFLILDDKSSNDAILIKIVNKTMKDASPFDKFPKDLKYDERNFNLEISFELE